MQPIHGAKLDKLDSFETVPRVQISESIKVLL